MGSTFDSGQRSGRGRARRRPTTREAVSEAPMLGRALLSAMDEAEVGMCVKDREIMAHVSASKGFEFRVEGSDAKMKPGLMGTSPGDQVTTMG